MSRIMLESDRIHDHEDTETDSTIDEDDETFDSMGESWCTESDDVSGEFGWTELDDVSELSLQRSDVAFLATDDEESDGEEEFDPSEDDISSQDLAGSLESDLSLLEVWQRALDSNGAAGRGRAPSPLQSPSNSSDVD